MSRPKVYNWPDLYIGTKYGPIDFIVKDASGNVIDVAGWIAFCQVRTIVDNVLVLNLSPVIQGDASLGTFRVEATSTQTASLTEQTAEVDLILEDSTGNVLPPVVTGKIQIISKISATS